MHADGPSIRDHYRAILSDCAGATVYQTIEWLSVFKAMGSELVFAELGQDMLLPFLCKGRGPLARAYSLPYDTYGGPIAVTSAPISFAQITELMQVPTVRVVDYAGSIELNGAKGKARDVATYIVDLEDGYDAVFDNYADTNKRLVRQSVERGLRITTMDDEKHLSTFHRLHRSTMRRYKTVGLPLAFFQMIYQYLVRAGLATFYLAWYEDEVIAGNVVLRYGNNAYDLEWVYNERFAHMRPTNALIDRAIADATSKGAR